MGLEKFIHFIIQNNETIILLTVASILILCGMVVYLNVFKSSSEPENEEFKNLEETLKRILAQTNVAISRTEHSVAATEAAAGEGTAAAGAEVDALKGELEQRKKTIEALQEEVKKAKAASDGSAELLAKIKTLEGKLAEYEIIEDDIADLSHYKDENARLKKELEVLKKRGGPELVDAFATAMESGESASGDTPASDAAAAASEETAAAPATSDAAASTEAPATPDAPAASEDDESNVKLEDLVAQAQEQAKTLGDAPEIKTDDKEVGQVFSAEELKSKGAAPSPAPTASETPAPEASDTPAPTAGDAPAETSFAPSTPESTYTPPSAEAKSGDAAETSDAKTDIFAEFSSGAEESDPLAELGEIDTNKMLEELQGLNVDMSAGAETLNESPDMDKMAEEAQKLGKEDT